MSNDTSAEIAAEQKYFDQAWDAREAHRARISGAADAAAGSRAAARAVRLAAAKYADRVPGSDEEVAFGRVDLDDGETYYVGKQGIFSPERDLLVVNWQIDEFARYYFESSVADPLGVARKRAFATTRNRIDSFDETLYADLVGRVAELTEAEWIGQSDVLLRDLEQTRDGEMRDIVQTIEASQYALIRRPLDEMLVVQGGPGTGKTAVALHRASWLLFNHRDELRPEDVLVIGPSKTFNRYIEKVLPGLGDEGVVQRDLLSLGPISGGDRAEALEVTRLKGRAEMAQLLRRALRLRVRFPERSTGLPVGTGAAAPVLEREDVEAQLDLLRELPTYNQGRLRMREWIQRTANGRTRGTIGVDAVAVDAALERVWPQLTPAAFLQDLLGSRQRITAAAGDDFTAGDIERLYRASADRLANETWSAADVALLDEADELIAGGGPTYAHVIVDEAQDLSPMQLRSVRRRSAQGSCTIVGDIAQSTGAWARASWDDVVEQLVQGLPAHREELRFGYRVPAQVMELADRLLPFIAPGLEPAEFIRRGQSDPAVELVSGDALWRAAVDAATTYAGKGLSVGVVCADAAAHERLVAALRENDVQFMDAARGQLGSSINVMTAEQAKGLELDTVVVVEPADIAAVDASGLRRLYIALTRATKHLTIVHSRRLDVLGLTEGDGDGDDHAGIETVATAPAPAADAPAPNPARVPPAGAKAPSLRQTMVLSTASYLAEQVRDALRDDSYEDVVRALAAELGVDLSTWPGQQLF
jgi:DNA helicase IV